MPKPILEYGCHKLVAGAGMALFLLAAVCACPARAQGNGFGGAVGAGPPHAPRTPLPRLFSSQPVALHLSAKFDPALNALFAQTPVNYIYALRAAPANTASLDIKNAPFDDAFNLLLRAYPAVPPLQSHLSGNVLSLMQNDPPGQKPDLNARHVTLRLKNVLLRDALNALFAALGTEHAPVDKLEGRVTLTLRDAPHERALQALIKQSPRPLTLLERDNMLIIQAK